MKIILAVLWLFITASVLSEPVIKISSHALVEEYIEQEDGTEVMVRKVVTTVDPGTEIIFELVVTNEGTSTATGVNVNNPVPNGTYYLEGSAKGVNSNITASFDNEEFLPEAELLDGELTASDIRYLRWTLESIGAQEKQTLEFRVKVNN